MKRADIDDGDIELLERDDPMQRMPFLATGKTVGRGFGRRLWNHGRHFRNIGVFLILLVSIVFVMDKWGDALMAWVHSDTDDAMSPEVDRGQPLHVLIPATSSDVNLCKTTLGLNVLGYDPKPVLLGWGKKLGAEKTLSSPQIAAKITEPLSYLQNFEKKNDKDLVLIADGYDVWFQLTPEILRERYFRLNRRANFRMRERLGRRAIRREGMKQTVIFGARKDCNPNGWNTVGCYPIPESIVRDNLYGDATDSADGADNYSSYRPRYLDSGYMIGPLADVRRVLERAKEIIDEARAFRQDDQDSTDAKDPFDGKSKDLYQGSPQYVFQRIFGEQAFQREVIRQRYRSWFKKWSLPRTPGSIEGHYFDDLINPNFKHEKMKKMKGHPREFGISVDYFGALGTGTIHSDRDIHSFVFNGAPESKFATQLGPRETYDCSINLDSRLPPDIANASMPLVMKNDGHLPSWSDVPLIGNVCLGSIPVMIHHNGDEKLKTQLWSKMWYQHNAKKLLKKQQRKEDSESGTHGPGVWVGDPRRDRYMNFDEFCPSKYDNELFKGGTST